MHVHRLAVVLCAIGMVLAGCTATLDEAPLSATSATSNMGSPTETGEAVGVDNPTSTVVSPIVGTTTTAPSTTTTATTTTSSAVAGDTTLAPPECPPIGPDRIDEVVGPVFVCNRLISDELTYGGQPVSRPDVDTAEEAIIAWLDGPNEQEQAAGLQGWDLSPHPWFAESLTLRREGTTLIMELSRWEPINNLSTSTGSAVFYTSLFATVFSDPTVEQFKLSIMGESCPVYIGEGEWCFPIDWNDFAATIG